MGPLIAVLAVAGFFLYRAGEAPVQVEFTQWKLTDEENHLLADRAQRDLERRREDNTRKPVDEAKKRTDLARADALRVAGMHDWVREYFDAYRAAVVAGSR
jgi:hypothetical protein